MKSPIDVPPDRDYIYTEGVNPIIVPDDAVIHGQKPTVTMIVIVHFLL